MNNISKEIRAKLKRLCPYVGSYIPNPVRENAKHLWPAHFKSVWASKNLTPPTHG